MKLITIIFLVLFSFNVAADGAPKSLVNAYANQVALLADKFESCKKDKVTIDVGKIRDSNLPREEVKTALNYLFSLADYECSKHEIGEYLVLSLALKEYGNSEANEKLGMFDSVVISSQKGLWRARENYLKLPVKTIALFEGVPGISTPFNVFQALDDIDKKSH